MALSEAEYARWRASVLFAELEDLAAKLEALESLSVTDDYVNRIAMLRAEVGFLEQARHVCKCFTKAKGEPTSTLLTTVEAAVAVGVSARQLRSLRKQGKIEAVRIGPRSFRYTHRAIQDCIRRRLGLEANAASGEGVDVVGVEPTTS